MMKTLNRELRRQLESTVREARRTAENGARKALQQLYVGESKAPAHLSKEQRSLRTRLRLHARQLGDSWHAATEALGTAHLVRECAYEHWHRMLFARFLAENELLIEPEHGVPISVAECRDLAQEKGKDWLLLASGYAQEMLPQIFRTDDPVLALNMPPETRSDLDGLLENLPDEIFRTDDSLGWVYQFWQSEEKEAIHAAGNKIDADSLPVVTQLFTEDYMVQFLLHNTLGAWWAGRVLHRNPHLSSNALTEATVRRACALPSVDWEYLRFVRLNGTWIPAAGIFERWPSDARSIRLLDPCMGSGHFLVSAIPILIEMRMHEEGTSREEACVAVLKENIFGLEVDPRCTQIAAFNVALTAWRMIGYRPLPTLSLACSGLAPNASEPQWKALAAGRQNLTIALSWLFPLFQDAPVLGSLIDLGRSPAAKIVDFKDLRDALLSAARKEQEEDAELGVRAFGLAQAAEILAGHFTLVVTNVPYLGRAKQGERLSAYCADMHPAAKSDLATCFIERCLRFCHEGGTAALVTPQNWFFLGTYRRLRESLLSQFQWDAAVTLGPAAFQDMNFWAANTALCVLTSGTPDDHHRLLGLDASGPRSPEEKSMVLQNGEIRFVDQSSQLKQPDARVVLSDIDEAPPLSSYAAYGKGSTTGDSRHYLRHFWEFPALATNHTPWLDSPDGQDAWSGRHLVLTRPIDDQRLRQENGCRIHGQSVWGKRGFAINKMNQLRAFAYAGELFDDNVGVVAPTDEKDLAAVCAYLTSPEYNRNVRAIDQKVIVTAATLTKVPFDIDRWRQIALRECPDWLRSPNSGNPTQWLFNGQLRDCDAPLHVGAASLVGYRWPRQSGSSFPGAPALDSGVDVHADEDGIVPLSPIKGEAGAASRLVALLSEAFDAEWSAAKLAELLAKAGHAGISLDEWLCDHFFEEHCELFHQRPFVWHIWDGRRDGFNVLVNYHRLVAGNGEGKRLLSKLTYSVLGDWIDRQRSDQKAGVEGSDARLAAAEHLKVELERILQGNPPYDIFVRWKKLSEQAIGWEPEINDGVRMNIRPFMTARPYGARGKNACILRVTPKIKWDKDRGKESQRPKEDYPWFWAWDESPDDFEGGSKFDGNRWNDLHYTNHFKLDARKRQEQK